MTEMVKMIETVKRRGASLVFPIPAHVRDVVRVSADDEIELRAGIEDGRFVVTYSWPTDGPLREINEAAPQPAETK